MVKTVFSSFQKLEARGGQPNNVFGLMAFVSVMLKDLEKNTEIFLKLSEI